MVIPGWPNYEVSEYGNVRRFGRILKKTKPRDKFDYYYIGLSKNGRQKVFYCHTLVALAFLGRRPSLKHNVSHINGNRLNNHYTNLRWATQKENMQDTIKHGTRAIGERHGMAKINEDDVRNIRSLYQKGTIIAEIVRITGLTRGIVNGIVYNLTWQHVL